MPDHCFQSHLIQTAVLLTPDILLTKKSGSTISVANFSVKDLYGSQWRRVQSLADEFWACWKWEYLPILQRRCKWATLHPNLEVGAIVLMKDITLSHNEWPMAVVTATFPSTNGRLRKREVKTTSQGITKKFLRPISEVILLLSKKD